MFFLPVVLLLLSGGSASVVQDFQSECGEVFYHRIPPTVFPVPRFRQICQTQNNLYYYATLYDTLNKIPVYSAYVFTRWVECRRSSSWYIEPQLESRNLNPNMMVLEGILFPNQASNTDYEGSGFDKGHLAPVSLAFSQGCADATFTLTNAAPQNPKFNRGQWRLIESGINRTLSSYCKGPAYIVTGVLPGIQTINQRVRVPSYFWTAYCCQITVKANLKIAGGFIGENKKNPIVGQLTVTQLEIHLGRFYGVRNFRLFHNSCRGAVYVPVIKQTAFDSHASRTQN